MTGLADRQAALVRALVASGEPPEGFDRDALETASKALLRKRSGGAGESGTLPAPMRRRLLSLLSLLGPRRS
ncbi:hypothetical protein JWS13_25610 [Rhodococcus pseudokoreensis]|uniref:SCO6045-like C-terminal domain-containing protein n=1 Tax=Rhodococcus pseudokoreensis TaxID=2811421 RepID=A0A974WE09_9NOCA|nr:hypothetical protein [Rhodococcus pseudokoreensis]QSE95824.1 hypothetical protein JWS13_25610 [Rhodococcus pseudokoreensis]